MFIGIVKCIVFAITISILYGVIGYLNHKKADYRRRFDENYDCLARSLKKTRKCSVPNKMKK